MPVIFTDTQREVGTAIGSAWTDIDLSSILPSAAANGIAIFRVHNSSGTNYAYKLRKKGSTDNRVTSKLYTGGMNTFYVGLDSNRVCQGWKENAAIKFYLWGYIPSTEGSGITNGISYSLTANSLVDVSAHVPPNATYAIFENDYTSGTSASTFSTPIAKPTSIALYPLTGPCTFLAPLTNGITKHTYIGTRTAYLIGYLTTGPRSPAYILLQYTSSGAWIDVDVTPYNPLGYPYAVVQIGGSATSDFNIKNSEFSYTPTVGKRWHGAGTYIIPVDSSGQIQVWSNSTTTYFYLVGFMGTPTQTSPNSQIDPAIPLALSLPTADWYTLDLSAFTPAGATGVYLINKAYGTNTIGFRPIESSANLYAALSSSASSPHFVKLTNNKSMVYSSSTTTLTLILGGWFGANAVFFPQPVTKYAAGTGAFVEIDVSDIMQGDETYYIIQGRGETSQIFNFTRVGSTDNRYGAYGQGLFSFIVGAHPTRKFLARVGHINTGIDILGYIVTGSPKTNATIYTTTTGGWRTIDLSGDSDAGNNIAIVELYSTATNDSVFLRKTGSSENLYDDSDHLDLHGGTRIIDVDSAKTFEAQVSSSIINLCVLGYMPKGSATGVPIANFYGTPTNGNAPLSVAFVDSSSGTPTSWDWSYSKDGGAWVAFSSRYSQYPTQVFTAAGNYSIRLTVSNIYGSDTKTLTDYIVINPVVANFSVNKTTVSPGEPVAFTDTSTGAPTAWEWSYAKDGGSWVVFSIAQNPNYGFASPGSYSIRLIASNVGHSDTEIRTNYITVSGSMTINTSLPKLQQRPSGMNGTSIIPLTLRSLSILADMPGVVKGLPRLTLQGGGYWAIIPPLPKLVLTAWLDQLTNDVNMSLPRIALNGILVPPHTLFTTLPELEVSAILLSGSSQYTNKILPSLTMVGVSSSGSVGLATNQLPDILIQAILQSGSVGVVRVPLSRLRLNAIGTWWRNITSTVAVTLPALYLLSFGTSVAPIISNLPAIVMNVRNSAISRYYNFDYNSITQHNDIVLASKANGIYLIEGSNDNGIDIVTELCSGLWDLGSYQTKRITDVYLSMRTEGAYTLTLITDDGNAETYDISDNNWNLHNIKTPVAKGHRGKYWAWSLTNKNGNQLELDHIELVTEIKMHRRP